MNSQERYNYAKNLCIYTDKEIFNSVFFIIKFQIPFIL